MVTSLNWFHFFLNFIPLDNLLIRSRSTSRGRHPLILPTPLVAKANGRNGPGYSSSMQVSSHHSKQRPPSPLSHGRDEERRRLHAARNHRIDDKVKIRFHFFQLHNFENFNKQKKTNYFIREIFFSGNHRIRTK